MSRRQFRYDAFLSYSHLNKAWVQDWLIPQLDRVKLTTCVDYKDFTPGAPSITEMEQAVVASRKTIIVLSPEYLLSKWTEFENILVQTVNPLGRLIPLLLSECEPPLRIKMLTYIDFTSTQLQEQGISRLVAAIRQGSPIAHNIRPRAIHTATLPSAVPTGAMLPGSPFYIERQHDEILRRPKTYQGSTIIIKGSRQMGKSSLAARALTFARGQGFSVIDLDLQDIDSQELANLGSVVRYLAECVHERLRTSVLPVQVWQNSLGHKNNLTSFLETSVLSTSTNPVVLVIDEVNRICGQPYQDDFFGLLRAWHNRRARHPLWKGVNLIIAISSEPKIKDPHQSPFNVGTTIALRDFSEDEVWELNRRYGRPLPNKVHVHSLWEITGGHPYMSQQALYTVAAGTSTPDDFIPERADVGPFAEHLQHNLDALASDSELSLAMMQIIGKGQCQSHVGFERLRVMGLVEGTGQSIARPRCRLYAEYFQKALR